MKALSRLLGAAVALLLVAGVVGAVTMRPRAGPTAGLPGTTTTLGRSTTPTTTVARPVTTTVPGPPGPTSAALAEHLLVPNDLGGFVRPYPAAGAALLASAPCLAGLAASPAQDGRALTGLFGGYGEGLPVIVEVVSSYPGGEAGAVYRRLASALLACKTLVVSFDGQTVRVSMARSSISLFDEASTVIQGHFTANGRAQQVGVAVALRGQTILGLVYIDAVPPAFPILGDLQSTLVTAAGKMA